MFRLNERQGVTVAIFALAVFMLIMAWVNPKLWEIKLFEILLQAVIISGIIGSILAFHFSANKSDEVKSSNTGKAFDAIVATVSNTTQPAKDAAIQAADDVASAASDKADEIAGDTTIPKEAE